MYLDTTLDAGYDTLTALETVTKCESLTHKTGPDQHESNNNQVIMEKTNVLTRGIAVVRALV